MKREKFIEMQIERFREKLAEDLEKGKIDKNLHKQFIYMLDNIGIYNTLDFNHGMSFMYKMLRKK